MEITKNINYDLYTSSGTFMNIDLIANHKQVHTCFKRQISHISHSLTTMMKSSEKPKTKTIRLK